MARPMHHLVSLSLLAATALIAPAHAALPDAARTMITNAAREGDAAELATVVKLARRSFPDLPVLFMSGYAEEQLRKSIDIAKVAFLPKPFSVNQLAEAARDALASRPPAE